jgi:hypothetical protein
MPITGRFVILLLCRFDAIYREKYDNPTRLDLR